jgi:hypothetical protein
VTSLLGQLGRALANRGVRYVLIGVSGANLYAPSGGARFATEDFDLFLPRDAENLVNAWTACEDLGFDLGPRSSSCSPGQSPIDPEISASGGQHSLEGSGATR